MWKLRGYLKDYRKELVLGPSFKLLEAIFELLIPALVAKMIDIGVQQQDREYIIRMGIAMLVIAITGTACAFLCQYYAARVAQGFGTELRNRVFEKIGQLSHADLDRLDAVTLTNRVTNDVNALQWAVAMLIRLVIRAPFLCIGGFIMAFLLDFSLSLIILMALPVFTVLIAVLMKRSIPMFQQGQKRLDGMTRILRENLSGVRPIRAFAMEERETVRFQTANEELSDAAYRAGKASALLNPLTALVLNAAILLVVGFGGIRLHAGTLSAGTIIAFINYLTQILAAMIVVANLAVVFTKAAASAVRVNEVLDWVPSLRDTDPEGQEAGSEVWEADSAKPMNAPAAQKNTTDAEPARIPYLSFEGVSFSYPGAGEPSLSDIRFAIEKGQTLGIVGVTGAGKSSLLSLIARFYDPDAGVVRLQGRDLRTLPLRGLRRKIGLVSQNPALFSGTVEENIRWGNQDASDDQVREAARLAQADIFIGEMQEDYGSRVERGGRNLSGGQRQRLAIARALGPKTGNPVAG